MARGDQVYVYREFFSLDGVYEHHGIDCGDGLSRGKVLSFAPLT